MLRIFGVLVVACWRDKQILPRGSRYLIILEFGLISAQNPIYMYIYIYTCIYTYTHVCRYVCICVCVYIYNIYVWSSSPDSFVIRYLDPVAPKASPACKHLRRPKR